MAFPDKPRKDPTGLVKRLRLTMGPLPPADVERLAETVAREYLEDPDGPDSYPMRMFAISYALNANLTDAMRCVPWMVRNQKLGKAVMNAGHRNRVCNQWLKHPGMKAFIDKIRRKEVAKVIATEQQLDGILANLAATNAGRCFNVVRETKRVPALNPDGSPKMNEDGTPKERTVRTGHSHMELRSDMSYLDLATIRRIKTTTVTRTQKNGAVDVTTYTDVELHDAREASWALMQRKKMIGSPQEGAARVLADELGSLIREIHNDGRGRFVPSRTVDMDQRQLGEPPVETGEPVLDHQ